MRKKKIMQLYALDHTGARFFIFDAEKGKDYFCIECGERVRVRSGSQRVAHFYHVFPEGECRQAGKSDEHILLQTCIQKQIGSAFCEQEVRFPEISRIADVAWVSEKIVFEIQCSAISKDEVEARCQDYAKIGWYVVWVLLDRTFLRHTVSDVVAFLQNRTHYYASAETATMYDLFSWDENGNRKYASKRHIEVCFEVDLSTLTKNMLDATGRIPAFLSKRLSSWQYYARKDLLWQYHENANDLYWQKLVEASISLEEKNRVQSRRGSFFFYSIWHYIVESALAYRRSK